MNWYAVRAIYQLEMNRTWRTLMQSVLAPVLSTSLYFVVFGSAIGSRMANVEGVPYGVRLYDTPASPAEVVALYDAEMKAHGWEPSVSSIAGEAQRAYSRPGADLLVITSKDGDRTIVSLVTMGTAPAGAMGALSR